jgi:hypothetical protein
MRVDESSSNDPSRSNLLEQHIKSLENLRHDMAISLREATFGGTRHPQNHAC